MPMEPTDILGRMATVEQQCSRIPVIEQKVDRLADRVNDLRVEGAAREATSPRIHVERGLLEKIDVMEVVKLGLILGAILGGMWYARPSHDELRQVMAEVRR